MREVLILARRSFVRTMDDQFVPVDNGIDRFAPGDEYVVSVAAPGYGQTVYRVTRVTENGLYGVVVESTVRELTEGMVR